MKRCYRHLGLLLLAMHLALGQEAWAQERGGQGQAKGQAIYVPAYSHIYAGNREIPVLLTVTLSIRNTDPKLPITLTVVDYYGSNGELIKHLLSQPLTIGPFATSRYVIPQRDESGGSGANFLVEWSSPVAVNPPLVETVMIGSGGPTGISFTSRGQVIQPRH